jgi:hypothetical protein
MRFNVDRICELAGINSDSKNLLSEVTTQTGNAPGKVDVKAAAAAAAATKPAAAATKPAAKESFYTDDMDDMTLDEEEISDDSYMWDGTGSLDYGDVLDDSAMYEIEEEELMEALVDMRQARLEESAVRDAVRDEIARALSDKSSSWMYGSNKPTASRQGQIARGGFGVGFGFKR